MNASETAMKPSSKRSMVFRIKSPVDIKFLIL
jgi:hypothetical protein